MYNSHFGFHRRPFASVAHFDQYVPTTATEAARVTLARCLERGEGAGMVVGPSGTGKTLLCQVLAEQFKDAFRVALLSSGRLSTRRALFQAILYELGQPYRAMDEGELRLALVDYLTANEACPEGIVLLVDEAHTLPIRLLEETRMLTNVARDGRPRVRLVLAGGSALEERLANPKLDSFSQRLVARCYLEPLNRTETQQYIHAQVDSAGGSGEAVFPAEACQSVFRATDGVPRLVNQVCDHALLLAYTDGLRQLEPAQIEGAWADLQQLPTPWNQERADDGDGSNVIEFGGLDDSAPDTDEPADPQRPPLRISPETDWSGDESAEPSEQLEHIEEMLAGVDEEFRPAGTIVPEVELVFDEPDELLREEFEEEEVVADRCALPSERREASASSIGHEEHQTALEDAAVVAHGPADGTRGDDEDAFEVDEQNEAAMTVCPIGAVQRPAYGRLFANLRRG